MDIYIYNYGQTIPIYTTTSYSNSLGDLSLELSDFSQDRDLNYDIIIDVPGYLKQIITSTILNGNISFPALEVGDLNNDNDINSLDWGSMLSKWNTSDSTADLNEDSLVNSVDFSFMNKNWMKTGD